MEIFAYSLSYGDKYGALKEFLLFLILLKKDRLLYFLLRFLLSFLQEFQVHQYQYFKVLRKK